MTLLQQNTGRKKSVLQENSTLLLLIFINAISFIILAFFDIVYQLNNSTEEVFKAQVLSQVSVPAQPPVFATRPWTLLTYMFSHFGIWDLVSSMLWLWGYGVILKRFAGNDKLFPVYLYGGLIGSILFLLVVNVVPSISANVNSVYPLLGSGPALMALAVAATTLEPRYRIFPMVNIPLWAITVLFVIIRIASFGFGNPGHITALLAGGLTGYLFIWQLQRGNNMGKWMNDLVFWMNNLFNPDSKWSSMPVQEKLFYKSKSKPFQIKPHITQQRIDELLEKIHHDGYESLTQEEKDFLKKASTEEL